MNTTDLFVELVIIGIGGVIWLFLLVFSLFGYDWFSFEKILSLPTFIPFLSIVYVLGIITDRIADTVFSKLWDPSLFKSVYEKGKEEEYIDDKLLIYVHPGHLGNLLEYGRSRLRICRGWTLNVMLIFISLNIFIWNRVTNTHLRSKFFVCSLLMILFAYGSWFSWRQINLTIYKKIQKQSAFLRMIKSTK